VTSAALGAEEPVEHLLKAVELALLDISTGFESISKDSGCPPGSAGMGLG
jgi:hypothetical protein